MDVNTSGWLLILMALVLGLQHGFDLDHLATIDSITRTLRRNTLFSRIVGLLFSFGHGLVVILVSLMIGSGFLQSHAPKWLETFGGWVSIIFLFFFGLVNLFNVFQNSENTTVSMSVKGYFVKKILHENLNPMWVILIGALFAFSFDTFSQVALFSISAKLIAGFLFSGLLGLMFMCGMMISDGFNGFLVSSLIQRADKMSIFISKFTGLAIAVFSLAIGIINLGKYI